MADRSSINRISRAGFSYEDTVGFRTNAWRSGVAASAAELKPRHKTLLHAFATAAKLGADSDVGITILGERPRDPAVHLSYFQLYHAACQVATGLVRAGIFPGHRVVVALPTSHEFITTFFAVQLLGAVAVPAYPPSGLRFDAGVRRLAHLTNQSGAAVCVVDAALLPMLDGLRTLAPGLRHLIGADLLADNPPLKRKFHAGEDDRAFIQYSSGSTGDPKGVVLSQRNLVSNIHAIGQAAQLSHQDRMVSWCPLYHDLGLILGMLTPIYWRLPLVLMSPFAFLSAPARWLRAMHDYRGTMTVSPNFGYALAVERVPAQQRVGLDLSSWRLAINGAETVSHKTIVEFLDEYRPWGLASNVMLPVYGLAEATVAVASCLPGEDIVVDHVDRQSLGEGRAQPSFTAAAMKLVAVGRAISGHGLLIVDEAGQELPEREVGHIVTTGPSLMQGYHDNPAATRAVLHDGWLWTGDLGYISGGDLFITGRHKDLIILRGRNYYPEDVEQVLDEIEGVRSGNCIAFGLYDDTRSQEFVILVCETRLTDVEARTELARLIGQTVGAQCELVVDEVVLAEPGTLPKTSSGKRQRSLCRELYLRRQFVLQSNGAPAKYDCYRRSRTGFEPVR